MPKRQIFYSFDFENDVSRVEMIRNIGALEDNKPVSVDEWEEVKKKGEPAIEKWIDNNMSHRSCVVVLIGERTANRKWIKYEIKKAWREGKGLLGVYIHNIECPSNGKGIKGNNPFARFTISGGTRVLEVVKCYNPDPNDACKSIKENLETWVENAIKARQ